MKSFFKKLSVVVLAAAMVLSVVPAMNATAAGLTIGVTKADAKTAYELNVGEDVDLAFFGATGYVAKTDSTNVEWKSSNTAVATVDKYGVVTAVKAGSTTISCTVKTAANNQTYTGSVTVTVKAAVASLEVTPKKYINGDFTYEIVFPTAAEATAAKAALDVKRVRVANGKRLELYTRVKASSVEGNVLTFSFAASNGVTYCVRTTGVEKDVVATAGAPFEAIVECADTIVPKTGDKDVFSGSSVVAVGNNIKCTVVDENDIVVAEFDGTAAPQYNTYGMTNVSITYKNTEKGTPISTKNVKLTKQGDHMTVQGTMSYKATATGPVITLPTNTITVNTIAYEVPTGLDFVMDMHLEASNKSGADVFANYKADCTFEETLKVRDTKKIFYVFNTTDVNGNAALATGNSANAVSSATNKVVKALSAADYKYTFKLDPEADHCIVLDERTGMVTAIKGGSEYIFLYQDYGNATKEQIVGYLLVTVEAEPYVAEIRLAEDFASGYYNAAKKTAEIKFTLFDQNGEAIKGDKVRATAFDKDTKGACTVTVDSTKNEGKITIDFSKWTAKQDEYYTPTLQLTNGLGQKVEAAFSVEILGLDTVNDVKGYSISVADKKVDNAAIGDNSADVTTPIKIVGTYNDIAYADETFRVLNDNYKNTYIKIDANGTRSTTDKYASLTDFVYSNELTEGLWIAIFAGTTQNTAYATMATTAAVNFVAYDKTPAAINTAVKAGTYTVYGWKIDANGAVEDELLSKEFTVSGDVQGLDKVSFTKTLVKASDEKSVKEEAFAVAPVYATGSNNDILKSIIGNFYGAFDANKDGDYADALDEVKKFSELAVVRSIDITKDEYILASDGTTVYIKSFTLNYAVPTKAGAQGSINFTVNQAYTVTGASFTQGTETTENITFGGRI